MKSGQKVMAYGSVDKRAQKDRKLLLTVVIIIVSNALCLLPVVIISILIFLRLLPVAEDGAELIMYFLPINALANPIIYALSSSNYKQNILNKMHCLKKLSTKKHTKSNLPSVDT